MNRPIAKIVHYFENEINWYIFLPFVVLAIVLNSYNGIRNRKEKAKFDKKVNNHNTK